jgi:hypothetical protein
MGKFISKNLLAKYRIENLIESTKFFSEVESKRRSLKPYGEVSVFLSHKHDEKQIIQDTILLLNKLGVEVYVDWLDEGMPKTTSGVTAKKIKEKIKQCDKFILLATEAAIASKWCNWELGLGDAQKYDKNIAIMPITEKEQAAFSGSEYLQIYPIITSEYYYQTGNYFVEFNDTKILLKDWLKRK